MFKYLPEEIFSQACQVNSLDEVSLVSHAHGSKEVWVLKNAWKDIDLLRRVAYEFPVIAPQVLVNASNPFFKQPVPQECSVYLTALLEQVLNKYKKLKVSRIRINQTWANIYQHNKINVCSSSIFPHADDYGTRGLVANIWLHPEDDDHATAFWRMKKSGSVVRNVEYDDARFRYLGEHPDQTPFFNFPGNDDIEKVLEVPALYGDITLYEASQLHSPVVSYNSDVTRHSWCLFMLVD